MAKVFNIFAGGKEDKNAKIVKNLLSSHVPTSSRPTSAAKRPSSANYNGIPTKPQKIKAHKVEKPESETYNQTSREDFLSEISELKRKVRSLEENTSFMKSENQRLESEATKQQRRIDQLMNLSEGAKNMPVSADIRKDIEKSILVRQLKVQITLLRNSLVEKDVELDAIRRNIKATHISEVEAERDEYYSETVRLSKILLELQDELLREKQRREWNSKLAGGTGEDLRKEVARLASGYQNILSNITTKMPSSSGVVRPQSSSGLGRSGRNNFNGGDETAVLDNKPKRPQSAVAKTSLTNYFNQNNNSGVDTYNSPSGKQGGQNAQQDFQMDGGETMSPMFDDPLDNFGGNGSTPLQPEGGGNYGMTDSSPFAHLRDSQKLTTPGSGMHSAVVPETFSSRPTSAQVRNAPYKVGEKVWGQFRGGNNWYNATVKGINATQGSAETLTFHILYDDGDEEKLVPLSKLRPLSHGNGIQPIIPLTPLTNTITVSAANLTSHSNQPPVHVPVQPSRPSQYKLNDKVEALYYKGTTYYPAKVTLVTYNEIDDSFSYDLLYDDGDREKKVSESSMRLKNTVNTAPVLEKPAEQPVSAQQSPKRSPKHSPKAAVVITPKQSPRPVEKTSEKSPEKVKASSPRSPVPKTTPTPVVVQSMVEPKFRVNDKIQGYFEQYNQWFDGTVVSVNSTVQSEVTYKILYDDGDKDDACAENKLRMKPNFNTHANNPQNNIAAIPQPVVEKPKLSPVKNQNDMIRVDPNDTILVITKSKFKRRDKVECQYGGMSNYYPAVIEDVRIDAESSEKKYLYDLLYDDGDRESDIAEAKIRFIGTPNSPTKVEKTVESPRNKATTSSNTSSPNKPVLSPVVPANSASKTRARVEIIREQGMSRQNGSDSDTSPVVSPRTQNNNTNNTNNNNNTSTLNKNNNTSSTGFLGKFQVNDKIQGYIDQYSQWFDGTIVGVNLNTNDYKVLYDDGDRDGHCAEVNLRLKDAPPTPAAPVAQQQHQKKPPSGNELDAFLNELSDDDVSVNDTMGLDGGKFVPHLSANLNANIALNSQNIGNKVSVDEYDEDFDA